MTPRRRRGFTLVEVMVVTTIMGVLIAIPVPTFQQAVEQSKLDVAAGQLRSVWAAQRLYRMENGRYGTLAQLAPGGDHDLIEPSMVAGPTFYAYDITVSADGQTFTATATHPSTPRAAGSLSIDESGTLTTAVTYNGDPMTPSMEPGP